VSAGLSATPGGSVASLHRSVGNQVVKRGRDGETPGDSTEALCPRCTRRYRAGKPLNCEECETRVQPKLAVSRPSDPAEREAERVADEVLGPDVRGSDDAETDAGPGDAETDTEPGSPRIRRSAGTKPDDSASTGSAGGPTVSGAVERSIASLRGDGRRLPDSTQSFFESRFGRDFSDVRVHTGGRADRLARSVDARAFTTGRDVVFRSGEYSPGTESGRRLLAHELTHVVQQAGGTTPVQRQESRMTSADLTSPRFEEQATLERVLDGEKILRRGDEGPAVFRVQQALMEAGIRFPEYGADGIYGDETAAAVMEFQSEHGLQVDGVVGPSTMHALDRRYSDPALPVTLGGWFPKAVEWSPECVLDIICEWNEPIVEDLRDGTISLETFTSAHVKMWEYNGDSWEKTRMYARGYEQGGDTIGLKTDLSCYEAAVALYQEWFHSKQPTDLNTRQTEGRAWRAHESWLLARGLPATESGFRQRDPTTGRMELDVEAVYEHVESEYYGASSATESVIGHDADRKDGQETKVEVTAGGDTRTEWREPKEGDKHRRGQNIEGRTDVDTSNWSCAGF